MKPDEIEYDNNWPDKLNYEKKPGFVENIMGITKEDIETIDKIIEIFKSLAEGNKDEQKTL